MGDRRVFQQMPRGGHDDRDPGLVVGTQQGRAAGGDDVVADAIRQMGRAFGRQLQLRRVRETDRATVVGAVNDRLHAGRVELRGGVDMGQQADRWRVSVRR